MMRRLLLLALLALGACVSPRESDSGSSVTARPLSKQWLAGGWVLEGDACESDAGIIYRPDGTWIADGAVGEWKIEKGRLVTTIVEQEDDAGAIIRLNPPVRKTEPIEHAATDHYQIRGEDGVLRRLRRCPAGQQGQRPGTAR